MFKSIFTIFLLATLFFLGGAQGWSGQDIEDRFIDPDLDTSKTIFLDVKDASLLNVLKIISQQTGLNFIADHNVEDKKITLYLNKIPLNQALQMILDANDLAYEMKDNSNIFVVIPKLETEKEKITKVYQLKYATVSSSKLNSTISSGGGSGGGSSSGGSGLEGVLANSLSKDGKVVTDPRTNSLIVTDVPGQFEIIDNTIAKLDVPIPQVLIEVEMLDVSKSVADKLGVQWGPTPLKFGGSSVSENWPLGVARVSGSSGSGGSGGTGGTGGTGASGSSGGGVISPGTFSATGLTAELNFLTTNTDARTLARPRLLTLNNQTAQIEISTDQAISIEAATNTTSSVSGNPQTNYTPERYTTGVILKVTPQANLLTREITMAVSPKVIDVILSLVQPPNNSSQGAIYDPETRGSDSILKLKDGQSMMIGGLLREEVSKTVVKVPILGDLPLIGNAFRSTNKTKTDRELVIFITPHIIDNTDQSAFKRDSLSPSAQSALDIQDAEDRVHEMNNSLNAYDMSKN